MRIPRREIDANKQFLDFGNLEMVARGIIEAVQLQLTPLADIEVIDNPQGSYFSLLWPKESGLSRFSLMATHGSKRSINYLEIYFRDAKHRDHDVTWYVGPPQGHTSSEIWATMREGKSHQQTMLELDFKFRSHLVTQELGHELLTESIIRIMQRRLSSLASNA